MKRRQQTKEKDAPVASAERIRDLLTSMQGRLFSEETKVSIGDFIRLLQLYQELEEDEPKEIRARWIERESSSET